mgnify:CR=1 FL=1
MRQFTPFFLSQRCVRFTTSVAMRLPCKSFTDLMLDSSGTASTQRVGWREILLKMNSPTSWTFEPFSTIQSCPVMPASR